MNGELDVANRVFDTGVGSGGTEAFDTLFLRDPDTIFMKAVVVEVVTDPAAFKSQKDFEKKYSGQSITNYSFVNRLPRNTIVARPVTTGRGARTEKFEFVLPFFPPHICFPVKPGEHVWVVSPAMQGKKAVFNHWICRVPSWNDTEDVNYSHEARNYHYQGGADSKPDPDEERKNKPPKKEENKDSYEMYGFPNGTGDFSRGYSFGSEEAQYCIESTGSLSYHSFKYEPVPRLTKRPGDLVLQGSNNTSITLGTTGAAFNGGWAATANDSARISQANVGSPPIKSKSTIPSVDKVSADPSETVTPTDLDPEQINVDSSPAIDIVAGRGYRIRKGGVTHDTEDAEKLPIEIEGDLKHPPTYPRVKKTVVHKEKPRPGTLSETSKHPAGFMPDKTDSHLDHPIEGDPDFRYDASRIYVAADGKTDKEFGLTEADGTSVKFSVDNQVLAQDGANIVLKSDHIRIIARKDPDSGVANAVNGSIRIIKEGALAAHTGSFQPNINRRAVIAIEPDGTIYIDGPKIIIAGREDNSEGAAAHGAGEQLYIGKDATEPLVLGQSLLDRLARLEASFNAHVHNTSAGPTTLHHGNSGGGGPGVPSPQFTDAELALNPAVPNDSGKAILSKVGKTK